MASGNGQGENGLLAQSERNTAPGWVIDGEGRLRRETIHHMGRRLPGWDYRKPWIYMVTIVLADRSSRALGELKVRKLGESTWLSIADAKKQVLEPDEIEAKVELSELGSAILNHWLRIGEFTPEIKPLHCEIMPDHIHLFLQVTQEMKRPLGNAIGGFKTGCEKVYSKLSLREPNPSALREPDPSALREHERAKNRLFAEGFVDSILFRRGQFESEMNYLRDNPRRLAIKLLFPELFKVVSEIRINFGLAPEEQNPKGLNLDLAPKAPTGLAPKAPTGLAPKAPTGLAPKAPAFGYFSTLGNRFLLSRQLVQAQVSRGDFRYKRDANRKILRTADGTPICEYASAIFAERRDELFALAKKGAVIISPCVSDGEREIARIALAAKFPLVTLQNKGFSPLQKPSGRHFDACAEGRLLMLAPAAWPYQIGEKPMSRFDAVALNRLAQLIAGEGAAEINYHGMKPANIEELAFNATRKKE